MKLTLVKEYTRDATITAMTESDDSPIIAIGRWRLAAHFVSFYRRNTSEFS